MENTITRGTLSIELAADPAKSLQSFPANEDWAMVVKIDSVIGTTATGYKIWDTAKKTPIHATVIGGQVQAGAHAVLSRIKPGNNQASPSFVCFASSSILFVIDKGLQGVRMGRQVEPDLDGNFKEIIALPQLEIVSVDPLAQFHVKKPPFATGRIYPAVKAGNKYRVVLPGYGDKALTDTKTFKDDDYNYTLELDYDGSGKLLDFRAKSTPVSPTTCTGEATYVFFGYENNDAQSGTNTSTITVFEQGGKYWYKLRAVINAGSGWPGHKAASAAWEVFAWDTYVAGVYSDKFFTHTKTKFGLNNASSNYILVEVPRTGTPDKDSFFPGVDQYLLPGNKYMQVCEKPGCRATANATYHLAEPLPRWELGLQKNILYYYNPTTDEFTDIRPADPAKYPAVALVMQNNIVGLNDSSPAYLFFFNNGIIGIDFGLPPGWTGIGRARLFAVNTTFRATTKHGTGGLIYASRQISNWKIWDDTKFINLTWPVNLFGTRVWYLADRWKSDRRSFNASSGWTNLEDF